MAKPLDYLTGAGLPQYETRFKMKDGGEILFIGTRVVVKRGNVYEFPTRNNPELNNRNISSRID